MKKNYLLLLVFISTILLSSCSQNTGNEEDLSKEEPKTGVESQQEKTETEPVLKTEEPKTGSEVKKEEKELSQVSKDLKEKLSDENKIWTVKELIEVLDPLVSTSVKDLPDDLDRVFDGQKIKIKGYAVDYLGLLPGKRGGYLDKLLVDGPINTQSVKEMKKLEHKYYNKNNALNLSIFNNKDAGNESDVFLLYNKLLKGEPDYFVPMVILGEIKLDALKEHIINIHEGAVTYIPFIGEKIIEYDTDNAIDAYKLLKKTKSKK